MKMNLIAGVFRNHPYRNIFVAMLGVILIDALAPNVVGVIHVSDLMILGLILAALIVTVQERRYAVHALALGVPAIVVRLIASMRPDNAAQNGAVFVLSALFFGFLIWNILHDLGRSGRATSERIFGALCAYLFIGVLFALLYAHLEFRDPNTQAFTVSNDAILESAMSEIGMLSTFTYYSFVTLTTLGYGDITPVSESARTLAWLEALLGQLFLAVMVAGLVATHISERMRENRDDPPPDG